MPETAQRPVTYRGERITNSTAGRVIRVEPDGEEEELDKRLDIENKSPTGLNWGYRGSGTAQAAIAILADAYNDAFAQKWYRHLANNYLATLEMEEGFVLDSGEIPQYLPQEAEIPGGER